MKEQVAQIVAAYLRRNSVAASDVPAVITQVYQSLTGLGQPGSEQSKLASPLKPAVPIRRSVGDDFVTCLECGAKALMLRRHLKSAHNLSPDDYRQRWKLPVKHPMVARNYASRRSDLAKAIGLGKHRNIGSQSSAAESPAA